MPESATRPSHYRRGAPGELTPRQQEVITLLAAGRTNPEIADALGISLDGAKWHVREIFLRLEVESRDEAVAAWHDWNRPRARLGRALRAAIPASIPARIAGIGAATATGTAGVALFAAAVATGNDPAPGPTPTYDSMILTPTPPAPAARACVPGEFTNEMPSATRSGSAVTFEQPITKRIDCEYSGTLEARAFDGSLAPPAMMSSQPLATANAAFRAPAGTTRLVHSVRWSNWCESAPTEAAFLLLTTRTGEPGSGGAGSVPFAPPPCIDRGSPTRLEITTRIEPDPPLTSYNTPTPTPSPAPRPFGSACVDGDLTFGGTTTNVAGTVVFVQRMTKPAACELRRTMAAFAVAGAGDPKAARLVETTATLELPAGTDSATITTRWGNWCGAPGEAAMWVMYDAVAQSGSRSNVTAPPTCANPGQPSTLEISVEPSPATPVTPVAVGAPPSVASPADLAPFVRWLDAVVRGRALTLLESLAEPMPGYFMDQGGTIGDARTFTGDLSRLSADVSGVVSAGCAANAPKCERFVVIFAARTAPGSYRALVFEVVAGEVRLRGMYPGGRAPGDPSGGDAPNVHGGGTAKTPWGQVTFVSLP
ncbi:MAG: helix-turn-helix transcriptional regulator [Dehalococcoidia bacterium]|nr:helix-turn-helix transcriptional regulator [Dehalococcoidia bacterium]